MEFHEDVIRVIFEFSIEILRAVEEKNFYAGGWPTLEKGKSEEDMY